MCLKSKIIRPLRCCNNISKTLWLYSKGFSCAISGLYFERTHILIDQWIQRQLDMQHDERTSMCDVVLFSVSEDRFQIQIVLSRWILNAQMNTAVVVCVQPYRNTVFESNPLQGITVCNPMLYVFLPQWGRDASGASVWTDLGPGQALGQFALWLGTGPGPREDGLTKSSPSIPHRQDGRKLRHLLLNK